MYAGLAPLNILFEPTIPRYATGTKTWLGVKIITTSPGLLPMRSKPRASRLLHCRSDLGVRYWFVSFASIQMGVSVGSCPFGNRYSNKLHFGISRSGKGEEKGIMNGRKGLRDALIWLYNITPSSEKQM